MPPGCRSTRKSQGLRLRVPGLQGLSSDACACIDTLSRRELTESDEDRAKELGTSSARAHREVVTECGACDCGCHALKAGRQRPSADVHTIAPCTPKSPHTGHDSRQLRDTAQDHARCRHVHAHAQPHVVTSFFLPSFLPSSFLPSSLPPFLPSSLPSFLPSFLTSLLYFLTSLLPSLLPYFLTSFLTSLLPSFLPYFLPSSLPSFLTSSLPHFLTSSLPHFLTSSLPAELPVALAIVQAARRGASDQNRHARGSFGGKKKARQSFGRQRVPSSARDQRQARHTGHTVAGRAWDRAYRQLCARRGTGHLINVIPESECIGLETEAC